MQPRENRKVKKLYFEYDPRFESKSYILQKEYIRDLYSNNNEIIFILECHIHRYHVAGIYRWQFFDFTMVCWITHLHDTLPD